jgi:hypothetical protein
MLPSATATTTPTTRPRLRIPRAHLAVYLLFLLVAIVITIPLVNVFSTRFLGHPFSDSYELARHIWWMKYALQTGQPLFSQPLLAYPDGLDGSLLWSYPLQSFPAWLFAFVMPLPAAYNLTILLRLALNGWSAYWLARYLTGGQTAPALVAGIIFMTYSTFQGHLEIGHPGLLALWPVPLYVYALFRLRDAFDRKWIALGALFFVMSQWGSTQLIVFTLFPITTLYVLALLVRREWRALRLTLLTVVIGGLFSLIFAVPLLLTTLNTPRYTSVETGVVDYSADLFAVIAPSFYHPLFRGNDLSVRVIGVDPFEGAAYVGIIAAVLALIGVVTKRAARWWLLLALVAWVFSLGPLLKMYYAPVSTQVDGYNTYVTLPWAAYYNLPLINITRTPGRFNFTVALAVAMMAAYGMADIWRRLRRQTGLRAFFPVLLLLIVFENQFFWPFDTVPGVVPEPIAALASRDDIRAVFDIPFNHPLAAKEAMWLQTGHIHPLIAGHMTRQTPVDPAKLSLLQDTLDPALLDLAGVDVVILHKKYDDEAGRTDAFIRDHLGTPIYEDDRFAVFDVPPADAAPAFVPLPTSVSELTRSADSYFYAPAPGSVRFRAVLQADGRDVTLSFDNAAIQQWRVDGEQAVDLTVPFDAPGYHTLTLVVDPPCPPHPNPTLECRAVQMTNLSLDDYATGL